MTTTAAVHIDGLTKTFKAGDGKPVHAVRGIDLTIGRGEIVAFLGPNGAGKTTTLDIVLGLSTPSSGTVSVLGQAPRDAVAAGQISAVLQSGGLLADLTVRETVQVIASTYRKCAPVDDVLARAGITTLANRRVSKCSGGEQQRLRFALALLPEPDILVLDEPTAGMDVGARHEFWETMRVEASRGRTVIFATHYLEEADSFADRIVMVARGKVIADGTTAQIRANASGRVVSATFASDQISAVEQRLNGTPGVERIEIRRDRLVITASDSDSIARLVLTDLGGTDVEITAMNLDSAFIALTENADDEGQQR